mgnify:CR=1 FL=1
MKKARKLTRTSFRAFSIGGTNYEGKQVNALHEVILSVGIDIGTSTTQLIFSRLTIENRASSYTVPRIQIVEKEVIYRSLIYFTPLKSSTEIDAEAVKKIVRDEYKAAGMTPEDVKTGAVIITGETADYVMTYMDMVEKAKAITEDLDARYEAFANAEAYLIQNALVVPLGLPVPPYIATRLNLWEGQYAPTGLSSNRLKGVHILDHYVSMDEYDQNRDAR